MSRLTVTVLGVGRVGRDLVRLLSARDSVRVVSAWSRNPDLAGSDLGVLAGTEPLGVSVTSDRDEALRVGADVAVVATTSFLRDLAPDLEAAIRAECNVICTGEETAFPWAVDAAIAERLDAAAQAVGVTGVGAGVNPGFVFDALAATLSGAAWDVWRIRVGRVVDVSHFSPTVLGRLGIGYTLEQFAAGRAAGEIRGHIGFPQSMHVVAKQLGCRIERVHGEVDPLLADVPYHADHVDVPIGRTAGFVQSYVGYVDGHDWFHATLTGHIAPSSIGAQLRDSIAIEGSVPVSLVIDPAFEAQPTVAAVLANSLARVVAAPAGWLTVVDLPPASSVAVIPQSNAGGIP
jgi:4-hydroxy-tetrahydrodipicolinate reductase